MTGAPESPQPGSRHWRGYIRSGATGAASAVFVLEPLRPVTHPIPETPEHRATLTRAITDRTGLDEAAIERVVRAFYAAARSDPLLGPVFGGTASSFGIGTDKR